jgi:hypothetical protein
VPVPPRIDVLLAGLLAIATLGVHDLGYVVSQPFWNDEFWVAISTKLPLSNLLRVTASSPPGWTLLLRIMPFGDTEQLRIVPLIFAAFTVIAAYVFARLLPWPSVRLGRTAATMAALAALLVPSSLIRNDLKQYTADAFFALVIFCLLSRLEADWSAPTWLRRLLQLAACALTAFLFSTAAVFVGTAVVMCVVLTVMIRREWARLTPAVAVAGACVVSFLAIYLVVYRPGSPPGLTRFWAAYYVPVSDGVGPSAAFVARAARRVVDVLGLGPAFVVLALLAAGITTLVRLRRLACALLVPIVLLLMIGAAAARAYPLFDVRTSHFLSVLVVVTAAVGAAGLCAAIARRRAVLGVALAGLLVVAFVGNAPVRSNVRAHSIPAEDLRTSTAYVAAHTRPGDTVVVSSLSSWGFAFYWPTGAPAIEPVTSNLQRFVTVFPDQPNILVARDGTTAGVRDVMAQARARATGPDGNRRIWLIHGHVRPRELADYRTSASSDGLVSSTVVPDVLQLVTVEPGP